MGQTSFDVSLREISHHNILGVACRNCCHLYKRLRVSPRATPRAQQLWVSLQNQTTKPAHFYQQSAMIPILVLEMPLNPTHRFSLAMILSFGSRFAVAAATCGCIACNMLQLSFVSFHDPLLQSTLPFRWTSPKIFRFSPILHRRYSMLCYISPCGILGYACRVSTQSAHENTCFRDCF